MKKHIVLFASTTGFALGFPAGHVVNTPREARPTLSLANITRISSLGDVRGRAVAGPYLGDFPDPSIISADGIWYAYGTTSNGRNVPVATSSDTTSWTLSAVDALPDKGAWADASVPVWAPDVIRNDDGDFVMYYTAWRTGATHCIGAAVSATATGPFAPQATPLVCNDAGGGVIDASGFDDGTDRWVVWKVDGSALGGATNCIGGGTSDVYMPTPIQIQRVARDGLTLLDEGEQPRTILDNLGGVDDGITEAPSLYRVPGGDFVLFYSTQCYASDNYDIQYAWSSTIDGPYTERGSLLQTGNIEGAFGPGGLDIDSDGVHVVFHARTDPAEGSEGARYLYSAALTLVGRSVTY